MGRHLVHFNFLKTQQSIYQFEPLLVMNALVLIILNTSLSLSGELGERAEKLFLEKHARSRKSHTRVELGIIRNTVFSAQKIIRLKVILVFRLNSLDGNLYRNF